MAAKLLNDALLASYPKRQWGETIPWVQLTVAAPAQHRSIGLIEQSGAPQHNEVAIPNYESLCKRRQVHGSTQLKQLLQIPASSLYHMFGSAVRTAESERPGTTESSCKHSTRGQSSGRSEQPAAVMRITRHGGGIAYSNREAMQCLVTHDADGWFDKITKSTHKLVSMHHRHGQKG
eukprot:CAMPEP_0119310690 /NCGR_PEP_ID=MMETSP1333-20130426/19731_1 /TAXON_ID=418940 /ORGANISM="Scyphosphaera apsteinii, Strain RCC1455" /LENGTH=176 /DNA_ID=CAMNT_0007314913 /DNA_START=843 /DNA_END=1374 /DNA_ORIENTATION=-